MIDTMLSPAWCNWDYQIYHIIYNLAWYQPSKYQLGPEYGLTILAYGSNSMVFTIRLGVIWTYYT